MHSVTDGQTDRQTDGQTDEQQAAGNSRSYCVTVRSAKNLVLLCTVSDLQDVLCVNDAS